VAVIECIQEIPCNVCEKVCPRGAIRIGKSITSLPQLNQDRCTGCGTCIPFCPGLAVFVVDATFSTKEALVSFPYEFLPLPRIGSEVWASDREGKIVARGKVVRVLRRDRFDDTAVVSISIPKKYVQCVRGIGRRGLIKGGQKRCNFGLS